MTANDPGKVCGRFSWVYQSMIYSKLLTGMREKCGTCTESTSPTTRTSGGSWLTMVLKVIHWGKISRCQDMLSADMMMKWDEWSRSDNEIILCQIIFYSCIRNLWSWLRSSGSLTWQLPGNSSPPSERWFPRQRRWTLTRKSNPGDPVQCYV